MGKASGLSHLVLLFSDFFSAGLKSFEENAYRANFRPLNDSLCSPRLDFEVTGGSRVGERRTTKSIVLVTVDLTDHYSWFIRDYVIPGNLSLRLRVLTWPRTEG